MAEQEKTAIRQVSLVMRQPAREHELETPGTQVAGQVQRDPVAQVSCREGDAGCAGEHASTLQRATDGQPARARSSLLRLQREYGNQYVRQVVTLARKGQGEADVTPEVEEAIQAARGGGQALDRGVRGQMEPAMGADFGGVRVHTGSQADALNRSLSARAFTTGQDIFFKQGEYSPGSSGGRELLAHELTHVVQQNAGVSRAQAPDEEPDEDTGGKALAKSIQAKLSVGAAGDQYEQEADRVASSVMRQEQQAGQNEMARRQPEQEKEKDEMQTHEMSHITQQTGGQVRRQVEEEKEKEEQEPVQAKSEGDSVRRQAEEDKKKEDRLR
jgi:hypothetical protein